jgi:hypothetical protein
VAAVLSAGLIWRQDQYLTHEPPQAFISYYYQLFESNRPALGTLYQEQSMLTFEGQKFQGTQNIINKLQQLPFGACKVNLSSKDFQPSVSGGIMVFVTGNIAVGAWSLLAAETRLKLLWVAAGFGSRRSDGYSARRWRASSTHLSSAKCST